MRLFFILSLLVLSACKGNEDIVGKWSRDDGAFRLEFHSSGDLDYHYRGADSKGTYSVSAGALTMAVSGREIVCSYIQADKDSLELTKCSFVSALAGTYQRSSD